MTNILLTLILAVLVALIVSIFHVLRTVERRAEDIKQQALDWITPELPGKPSHLAEFIDATASMVARAIVAQAKTTLMGMQSGSIRSEQAITGDIAQDAASMHPLGALLNSFPTVRKSLRRNPGLVDIALQALLKGRSAAAPGNGSKPSNAPQFKL